MSQLLEYICKWLYVCEAALAQIQEQFSIVASSEYYRKKRSVIVVGWSILWFCWKRSIFKMHF